VSRIQEGRGIAHVSTADLILYFLARVPGAGRTQIVKFLYLADLESRRCLGRPLTDLKYIWGDFGPFDQRIYDCLDQLRKSGKVTEEQYPSSYGGTAYCYRTCAGQPQEPATKVVALILEKVVTDIQGVPLRNLLDDVVYQTKPMLDANNRGARGQPLRMELVDNELVIPGLSVERAWEGLHQLEAGQSRPLSEILAKKSQ
jgi:hypothetical protein